MDILFVLPIPAAVILIIFARAFNLNKKWKAAKTIEEYCKQHPECKTSKGMACFKCGANHLKNWGFLYAADSRRIILCQHCGEKLYRIKEDM